MSELKQDAVDLTELYDEMENIPSNTSANKPFRDVVKSNITRRTVLQGSMATATAGFFSPAISASNGLAKGKKTSSAAELVNFKPVAIADVLNTTMPTISDDYQYDVIIPWGTPIEPGIVAEYTGDPNTRPTSDEASYQTGLGHDGMWFFPKMRGKSGQPDLNHEGMLCINHEYGTNSHALGKPLPESLEDVRLSQNIHGVSVLKLKRNPVRGWQVVSSPNTRRITVNTEMTFSGPVVGSGLLDNPAGNIPKGTMNNCGSGPTPWGTYLTCEENFHGYFGANSEFEPTEEQQRYGFRAVSGYGWYLFDERFDLTNPDYINEQNRFGWIVEIDPHDGTQTPVKRTAMGRFKHEAVAIAESANGRIAAYMGDDQVFDYCYKYVSDYAWKDAIDAGMSPLDQGTLYVARFDEGGVGEWLAISYDNPLLAERFASEAEMLVYTRVAADILGATPMDRPEWTTIGANGEVFWTMTNNGSRTVPNVANPEAPNSDGHIIRTVDVDDFMGTTFEWDIYLLSSDTRGTEGVFTDGDLAYCDEDGRLFIGTDGGQPDGLQDQLTVIDTTKEVPEPKRLLVGVNSDEITGFTMTPDRRTAFVNIQHPGNGNPISTNFPANYDATTIPRDCTLVITRKDGGIIGS